MVKRFVISEKCYQYLGRQDGNYQIAIQSNQGTMVGGQYERIIGVVNQSMYKIIPRTALSFNGPQEILLDVE